MKILLVAVAAVLISVPAHARTKTMEDVYSADCPKEKAGCKPVGKQKVVRNSKGDIIKTVDYKTSANGVVSREKNKWNKDGSIKKTVIQNNESGYSNRQTIKYEKGTGKDKNSAVVKSYMNCQKNGKVGGSGCEKFTGQDATNMLPENKAFHEKQAADAKAKEGEATKLAEQKKKEEAKAEAAYADIQKRMQEGANKGGKEGLEACERVCGVYGGTCPEDCKKLVDAVDANKPKPVLVDSKKISEKEVKKKAENQSSSLSIEAKYNALRFSTSWERARAKKDKFFAVEGVQYCTATGKPVYGSNHQFLGCQ